MSISSEVPAGTARLAQPLSFTRGRIRSTRSPYDKARAAAVILALHLIPLGLFWTGTSTSDWVAFGIMYAVMIFGVGGALHRYFAHRSFKTSRAGQFILGLAAGTALGDPVAFSGKHRIHHKHSDTPKDVHSPKQGVWYCWIGSLLDEGYTEEEVLAVSSDLTRYPELMWLHRYFYVSALAAAAITYLIGGYTMFATGFCLSFVAVLHATSAVNYFCHRGGKRQYDTNDYSTNRPVLSFFILGEGWHNNHHFYPGSARSGFFWYELDLIFCVLKIMSWLGIIWDMKPVPETVKRAAIGASRTSGT
jgi:stearoyl-CoA desaturase (delta-9 desaturase)